MSASRAVAAISIMDRLFGQAWLLRQRFARHPIWFDKSRLCI
jgi:hypothetical protein